MNCKYWRLAGSQFRWFMLSSSKTETRLTRPILGYTVTNKKTEKVVASRKSSIPVVAYSKQQNIIPSLTTVLFWQSLIIKLQCIKLWRVHITFQKYDDWSTTKALLPSVSGHTTIQTNVQQHENLQLIVALQVDQLWQHVVTYCSPVCPHQQTAAAKYSFHRSRGGRRTEDFYYRAAWNADAV